MVALTRDEIREAIGTAQFFGQEALEQLLVDKFAAAQTEPDISEAGTPSVAAMLALDTDELADGALIPVLGYETAGDGGFSAFRYSATSTATADDRKIYEPNSGVGRLYQETSYISHASAAGVGYGLDVDRADEINDWWAWLSDTRYVGFFDRQSYRIESVLKPETNVQCFGTGTGFGHTVIRPVNCAVLDLDDALWGGNAVFHNTIGNFLIWPLDITTPPANVMHVGNTSTNETYLNKLPHIRVSVSGFATRIANKGLHVEGGHENKFPFLDIAVDASQGASPAVPVVHLAGGDGSLLCPTVQRGRYGIEFTGGRWKIFSLYTEGCSNHCRYNNGAGDDGSLDVFGHTANGSAANHAVTVLNSSNCRHYGLHNPGGITLPIRSASLTDANDVTFYGVPASYFGDATVKLFAKLDGHYLPHEGTAETGVTAAHKGDGVDVKVELDLVDVPLTVGGGSGSEDLGVGALLYTLPDGNVTVHSAFMSVSISEVAVTTDTPDVGLGTTQGAGVVSDLSGTPGFENIIPGSAAADTNGTETVANAAPALNIASGGDRGIYFNAADTWGDNTGNATALLNGKVNITFTINQA